jgi:Lrp/AsnC family transcriptional regulator, regulator for asnA, asnC and gidA
VHGTEANLELVRHLSDGRKSYGRIAEEMCLAENTVRSRVKQLIDAGELQITALVDPAALPNHTLAFVGVRLRSMDFMGKAREFRKLRGVISAGVVTGRFHLMLLVLLNADYGLLEFYRDQVSTISDVEDAETFVVYGSENLLIPYVL